MNEKLILLLKSNYFSDFKDIFAITLGFSIIIAFAIYLICKPMFVNQISRINHDNVIIQTKATKKQPKQTFYVQQVTTTIFNKTNLSFWHNLIIAISICLIVIGIIIPLFIWYRQTRNKITKNRYKL